MELVPQSEQVFAVHVEDDDRRAPDRRAADQERVAPTKVSFPLVPARVEERRQPAAGRVHAGDVRPLVPVTEQTGQGEVILAGAPAVLPGDYVVDLERGRVVCLRDAAVLTRACRAGPDVLRQCLVHEGLIRCGGGRFPSLGPVARVTGGCRGGNPPWRTRAALRGLPWIARPPSRVPCARCKKSQQRKAHLGGNSTQCPLDAVSPVCPRSV